MLNYECIFLGLMSQIVDNLLVMYYMHVVPKTEWLMCIKIQMAQDVLIHEPI